MAEVPVWNLTALYRSPGQWRSAARRAEERLARLASGLPTVPPDAASLAHLLARHDDTLAEIDRVTLYAECLEDIGGGGPVAGRRRQLTARAAEATAAVSASVHAVGPGRLSAWIASEPRLSPWVPHLARILSDGRGPGSEPGAGRLDAVAGSLYDAYAALMHHDLRARLGRDGEGARPDGTVTIERAWADLRHGDRRRRARAFTACFDTLRGVRHTAAALLEACLEAQGFAAGLRGFSSALVAGASDHELPCAAVETLVRSVREHRGLLRRLLRARRTLLAVDDLRPWDLSAPLLGADAADLAFDAALDWIRRALAILGDDYAAFLERMVCEGWIDAEPRPGKAPGAHTNMGAGCPPFVLVNYRGTWTDAAVLAHEMGHAGHAWFSRTQPSRYAPTRLMGETVATLNEVLLGRHLINARAGRPAGFLAHHAETLVARVFRHTMLTEFECWARRRIESGGGLPADALDAKYLELLSDYYSPEVGELDSLRSEWIRIPHLYWNGELPLYPLAVAGALAGARSLDDAGGPAAFRHLLSSGSTQPATELLGLFGVRLDSEDALAGVFGDLETVVGTLEAELPDMSRQADHDRVPCATVERR